MAQTVRDAAGQTDGTTTDIAVNDQALSWLKQHRSYFTDALPRHVDQAHFIATARAILPELNKRGCTSSSIMISLLSCARFGLEPDGKHAAIVPYGEVATFQPMYEGYIDLMYRSGRIDSVRFDWVRANDRWDYTPTAPSPDDFWHKPDPTLTKTERGPVVLAYAYCWIKGGGRSQVILLNRQDAEEIRDRYSRAYANAERYEKRDSAWHTDFEAMWAKSAVRRLAKRVPTSPELVELLKADEDADAGAAPRVYAEPVDTEDAEIVDDSQDGHAADDAQPEGGAA